MTDAPRIEPKNASFFFRRYTQKHLNPDVDTSRLSEDRFVDPVNIHKMHPKQRGLLLSRDRLAEAIQNPSLLADMLADLVATAHTNIGYDLDKRTAVGVQMYMAALNEHGFARDDFPRLPERLHELSGDEGLVIWLAVGCQGADLLRRRASAAVAGISRVMTRKPGLQHCLVFCGGHPPAPRVSETNEADLLRRAFDEVWNEQGDPAAPLDRERIKILVESQSATTKQNVEHAFAQLAQELGTARIRSKYSVVIISNDFHLIRLSADFRYLRRRTKLIREFERATDLSFGGLFLVGAEYFTADETKKAVEKSTGYVKRFYFEVLSDFFNRCA